MNASEIDPHGELGGEIYRRDIGFTAPRTAIVAPGISALQRLNASLQYAITPGELGEQLTLAGIRTAVFGNADQGDHLNRSAVAIAMDQHGCVTSGDVSARTLLPDSARPFGVHTNYAYFLRQIQASTAGPQFVVVESGDGKRLAPFADWMTPARYAAEKRRCAEECANFALQLNDYYKSQHQPYLLCLAVLEPDARHQLRGDQLTPIILTGDGVPAGLLTSPSTHRPGLVINIDLTATILHFFGIKPDMSVLGYPMQSVPAAPRPLRQLQTMNAQMVATFTARAPVIEGYVLVLCLSILVYIMAMMYIAMAKRKLSGLFRPAHFRVLLIALMLAPLALIVAPALHIYATLPLGLFLLLFSLLLALALAYGVRELRLVFAAIGLATTLAICGDQLFHLSLIKHSILGFDPISGVRFYGIGNEYAGVLIGSSLLGIYALIDYYAPRRRQLLAPAGLLCVVIFIVLGAPALGAKFGGMVVAIAAFTYALARAYGGTRWKRLLWQGAACMIVLFLLMLLLNAHGQTHIGRAIADTLQNPRSLLDTALRKWAMNFRLVYLTFWALALLSLIVGIGVVSYRPVGMVRFVLRDHPILNAGLLGILLGMTIGFFTNDSGVVMAATGLIYLAFPLMLLVLREMTVAPEDILGHVSQGSLVVISKQ